MQNAPVRESISSKVILENRNKFTVTGVTQTLSANENCITLMVGKTTMYITGSMLHVSKLDIATGIMEGDGLVDTIKYGKSNKFLRKIFK